MEFTYKISETEYLASSKLKLKRASRSGLMKNVLFWAFVLSCLILLLAVVEKIRQQHAIPQPPAAAPIGSGHLVSAIFVNVGPFIMLGGIWVLFIFRSVPARLRRLYRKDPLMQGQFAVDITQESISIQNTAGTSSRTGWNIYDYWSDGGGIILLALHSGAYFLLSLKDLPYAQREELRSILNASLPKK